MSQTASGRVDLAGSIGLRDAADISARLQSALRDHDDVTVPVGDLTGIDIAVLQVLIAAGRSAADAGRRFHIADADAGILRHVLQQAGLVIAAAGQIAARAPSSTPERLTS